MSLQQNRILSRKQRNRRILFPTKKRRRRSFCLLKMKRCTSIGYYALYNCSRGTGKSAVPITDSVQVPFTAQVSEDGTAFEIRRAPGVSLDPAQKYSVGLSVTVDGRSGKTASPTAIGVKVGKAKFTAAPAAIQLLKQDRYSSGTVILSTADAGLSEIAGVFPANANYEVTQIGYGKYAVTYTGPMKSMKNATLKLNVFLEGNGGAKANAAVSLKVKFA